MKFSELWLREWVNPPIASEALADQLTMLGMEVEDVAAAAPILDGVVVGRVESVEKHPDADKLFVCTVTKDAASAVVVVTGAPGVKPGCCYPYAGVGVVLPGSVKVKETDIRGVTSTGMLCSAAELGLSEEADELFLLAEDAMPGAALSGLMRLDDRVFDIGLTPNRGDCLSINGIAREIAVINQMPYESPVNTSPVAAGHDHSRSINLVAPDGCPRYVGRIINNIDISRPSPLWLREKLRRCGLRSLNPVVDITNYVMLELGQPMHAFDNDKLTGDISVRYAAAGEEITLLDGESRVMPADTLVIADTERALAMAGVMGGLESAVSDNTRHVFLESAFFTPLVVAGRARQFGMHTDASHRFERGVDFMLQRRAMERATQLIMEICGGEPGPVTEAVVEQALPKRPNVGLRSTAAKDLLGEAIDMKQCAGILTRLGLGEIVSDADSRHFNIPSHRFDISIEADLIEEIARIYGYRNIKSALPPANLSMRKPDFRERLDLMRRVLVNRGYQEAVTYSFVSHTLQSRLFPEVESIVLLNAISSDMERMRLSLWPGLLTALQHNLNRQQERVRLFETGKIFSSNGEIQQSLVIGGVSYGKVEPEQWDSRDESADFYDIKADAEAVLAACCSPISAEFQPVSCAALHHGKAAEIIYDGRRIGLVGTLHPSIQSNLEIAEEVCLFEICLESVPEEIQSKLRIISKFPTVRRDLSILVDNEVPASDLLKNVATAASDLLSNLELIDVYQGQPVAEGKKSVTFGLTFQQTSDTLTDLEVDSAVAHILDSLSSVFGARLRE